MTQRVAAIALKIPDNAAFTAAQALKRLGLVLSRVERTEIWSCEDGGEAETFARRVAANESIFNPNKHRLTVLAEGHPRHGEVWIGRRDPRDAKRLGKPIPEVASARRYVGWRLFDQNGAPVHRPVLDDAVRLLLCNPAIDEALYER
ncbi:MAG TPA: hypothetical protein VGF98_01750 [Candidatus Tumulicola sp.]|jgi:hypothetical protein